MVYSCIDFTVKSVALAGVNNVIFNDAVKEPCTVVKLSLVDVKEREMFAQLKRVCKGQT